MDTSSEPQRTPLHVARGAVRTPARRGYPAADQVRALAERPPAGELDGSSPVHT
jgi:hypothetical protein